MLSFSIYDENNEVIAENRFRTVASPGACERLAVLNNWRSSSIHPYSYFNSDARKSDQMPPCHGVPSQSNIESIGIFNVRIMQKVFLTRPTVKHTRSLADKSAQRVYIRDGPDRPIRSRIPGPISDIEPVEKKIFDFEKCWDLEIGVKVSQGHWKWNFW